MVPAHWRDLPRLLDLEEHAHPHDAWSPGAWWAEMAASRREYLVAVEQEAPDAAVPGARRVVGYAGLDHGGSTADVMTITVDDACRGHGIGRLLMDRLVDRARDGGAKAVLLEVRADNVPALALYERTGFEPLSTRRAYYRGPDGPVDAVILRRLLDDRAATGQPTDSEGERA